MILPYVHVGSLMNIWIKGYFFQEAFEISEDIYKTYYPY